jgi:hypothetical protein
MNELFDNEKILALSWKQPFGTAMLAGKIETRVWSTRYRGPVLICTSKIGYNIKAAKVITGNGQYERLINACLPFYETLDLFGYAIAIGRLVDCREMREEDEDKTFVQYKAPWTECREGKRGMYTIDRRVYCHIYEDVRPIKPHPWRGSQGWGFVPKGYIDRINEEHPDFFRRIERPDNFLTHTEKYGTRLWA